MRKLELADRSSVERGGVSVIGRKNCGKRLRILDGRLWPVTGITIIIKRIIIKRMGLGI